MLRAALSRPDLEDPAFGDRWDALASTAGVRPFLRWTWVGCRAAERYADPVLVEVEEHGALVGLALFGRRPHWWGRALHLHESGVVAEDSVFVEHNGVVAAPGREAAVWAAMVRALRRVAARVVVSGVDDAWLAAARAGGGILGPVQTRPAPFVRLDPAVAFEAGLSRNTRSQVQRSDRSYAAAGPLVVERAEAVPVALEWFGALLALHLAAWTARGVASGLATGPVQAFLRALLQRGMASGEVELLRVSAGARVVGYLLNLQAGGRHCAYQSGFDYAAAGAQEKPGLTCHHAAIERARAAGAVEYDFLAGDARYKRSLGNDVRALHWLTWQRRLSVPGAIAVAKRVRG